ncbi:hypothetical protein [Azonexus fungiphilus]|uniref:hypothetical protein n=1 Tax=Azonexus fungiphilus TaxID=146940 RepID=UPI00156A8F05|nr:hypothetical protein [Azonexus fungiphilus]NHC05910.1 hypothetical protein [Azonexus fungiphilus]
MEKFDLRQTDLVEVMGSSLSRVKAMTSGRVKNFTQEELANLIDKLEIRAEWLATGSGPMIQDDEPQDEFANRMRNISLTHAMIDAMSIGEAEKSRAKALATGDPATDAKIIADALAITATAYQGGALTAREAALLDNYRAAAEEGKQALEATGAALAKPTQNLKKAG